MNTKRAIVIVSTVSAVGVLAALAKTAQVAIFPFPSVERPGVPNSADITLTPTVEGCAYMWAYHEAPELSARLEPLIIAIHPEASSSANYFGEDCFYADGRATFTAMETNFQIQLPVTDFSDQQAFGDWMAQVLEAILRIPESEIRGNYGFVEFWFMRDETPEMTVRVPFHTYLTQARGKSGTELFLLFSAP